jgi:hypothetical protein
MLCILKVLGGPWAGERIEESAIPRIACDDWGLIASY